MHRSFYHKGHEVLENMLILELKAVEAIAPIHEAQLLSYMKATKVPLGLIINFKVEMLKKAASNDSFYEV